MNAPTLSFNTQGRAQRPQLPSSQFSRSTRLFINSVNTPVPEDIQDQMEKVGKASESFVVHDDIVSHSGYPWVEFDSVRAREAFHALIGSIHAEESNTHLWCWDEDDADDELRWINTELFAQLGPEILSDLSLVQNGGLFSEILFYIANYFLTRGVDLDNQQWVIPHREDLAEHITDDDAYTITYSDRAATILDLLKRSQQEEPTYLQLIGPTQPFKNGAFKLLKCVSIEDTFYTVIQFYIYLGQGRYGVCEGRYSGVDEVEIVTPSEIHMGAYNTVKRLEANGEVPFINAMYQGEGQYPLMDLTNTQARAEAVQRGSSMLGGDTMPIETGYQSQPVVVDGDQLFTEEEGLAKKLLNLSGNGFGGHEEDLDGFDQAGLIDLTLMFGLHTKKWFSGAITNLQAIEWDKTLYDKIVMDDFRKSAVRAMVETPERPLDMVDDKGNNTLFLLTGGTGTGKTLLAEGVSHLQKRPLLKISFGELGTTVGSLETKMRTYLRYAKRWGAVALFDEADVFIEQRDISHLERTALVATFLSLLEYTEGTVFLTSNTRAIDPAIMSRVTMALDFSIDRLEMNEVWEGILAKADLTHFGKEDLEHFTSWKLNGRQIKNLVGKALRIAEHQDRSVDRDLIEKVYSLSQ